VWAYRKYIVAICLATFLLCAVAIKSLPKTFSATATLMVNNDIRDPLAGKEITGGVAAGYLATEMQLMESPEVLLPVIEQLKLTELKDYAAGYRGDGNLNLLNYVRQRLEKDLDVEQGAQGSMLINIKASSRDPVRAAAIANAVADVYTREQKQRIEDPASDRAKRYAEQLVELKQKVSVAQDQVAAFRQRTGVIDLSAQGSVESEVLNNMEHRLDEAQNQRRSAEVKGSEDLSVSSGVMSSTVIQGLKGQLDAQRVQLAQLTSTLGEHHPKVMELQAQMEATRRTLASELNTYSGSAATGINSARQFEQKMQTAIAEQREKVLAIRKLKDEGNKYMLELDSAQSVYKRALDGYDQIMFASAGHYNYVTLVSRAVVPPESSKPNKMKLLMAALLGSIALGFGVPLGVEFLLKRRIRVVEDLERSFGISVLAEFHAIHLSTDPA
jgi:protein tyrosine kinase modulator